MFNGCFHTQDQHFSTFGLSNRDQIPKQVFKEGIYQKPFQLKIILLLLELLSPSEYISNPDWNNKLFLPFSPKTLAQINKQLQDSFHLNFCLFPLIFQGRHSLTIPISWTPHSKLETNHPKKHTSCKNESPVLPITRAWCPLPLQKPPISRIWIFSVFINTFTD